MIKNVLDEANLLKTNSLVIQPIDLGTGDDKISKIKQIFKASRLLNKNQKNKQLIIIWFEDLDYICQSGGKGN